MPVVFRVCPTYGVLTRINATAIEISVVSEFINIFANFSWLLFVRVVEVIVDLTPNAAPVLEALYRMSLSKLGEAKNQLEELEAKGFTRPNSLL